MNSDLALAGWSELGYVEFNEGHFDQAVECMVRVYAMAQAQTDELYGHALDATPLAMILAATGRDATERVQEALDRAHAARWPTALSFAHFAAGLAVLQTDPVASLEALTRAVDIAVEVGNRNAEAIAQSLVIQLQKAVLSPAELAVALSHLLRHLQHSGDTYTAWLVFSNAIELLNGAGRLRTAALLCGWLDGRSGRNAESVGEHDAAVAAIRHSLGDQWEPLLRQGRTMTSSQVFDMACDELDTIE